MSLGKMCPSCGARDDTRTFIGNFCMECFSARAPLYKAPESLQGRRCPTCGRLRLREWVHDDLQHMGAWVLSKIKSTYDVVDADVHQEETAEGRTLHVRITLDVQGHSIKQLVDIPLTLVKEQCIDCSRKASGYFEAIIQLRGPEDKQERAAKHLIDYINRHGGWIAKTDARKEGIDLYVSHKMVTSAALAAERVDTVVSKKQAGMREGQTIYRTTYLVRLGEGKATGKMHSSS